MMIYQTLNQEPQGRLVYHCKLIMFVDLGSVEVVKDVIL